MSRSNYLNSIFSGEYVKFGGRFGPCLFAVVVCLSGSVCLSVEATLKGR